MRSSLRLFADRRFAFLLSARTVSTLGTAVSPIALAFAVLGRSGASAAMLGIVLAAQSIPRVLFMVVGGVVADRLPRYWVMVGAEITGGLSVAGLTALFLTGGPLPPIVFLAAISGTATAMFCPAFAGIVPQVAPTERLAEANGLLRLANAGSRIVGVGVAGALVTMLGPAWALGIDAASFLVSAGLLACVPVPRVLRDASTGVLCDLRCGWREFASRPWVWVIVAQYSIVNAVLISGLGVLGPLVAARELGGAPAWSMILLCGSVGTVLGVLVAMRMRPSRPVLVASVSASIAAPPFLALGLGAPALVAAAAVFLAGIGLDICNVLWATALQRNVPSTALSRVSSYDELGQTALGPLALLCAGPVTALVGIDNTLLGGAGLVFLAGIVAVLSPQVRRFAETAVESPAVA